MNNKSKGLGWRPDLPDIRDLTFESSGVIKKKKSLPSKVDLKDHPDMPPVWDQKSTGACTAFSVCTLCAFEYGKEYYFDPSKLFLYYVTRSLEGTVESDAGATIRSTIKAANEFGICSEKIWPYIESKFNIQPIKEAYDIASNHQAIEYKRVRQRLDDLRECLYEENLISFGICVYEGLYKVTKNKPVLEMPDYSQSMQGGHALVLTSYDDDRELFTVRNSWSSSWGMNGYFYIPYSYILNSQLASDFWTISLVER